MVDAASKQCIDRSQENHITHFDVTTAVAAASTKLAQDVSNITGRDDVKVPSIFLSYLRCSRGPLRLPKSAFQERQVFYTLAMRTSQ
eukprot:1144275-Pelagomonas_calceolata.AAC.3